MNEILNKMANGTITYKKNDNLNLKNKKVIKSGNDS